VTFGSAALVMVNYFFEMSDSFDLMEECQEFAKELLEHDKFLFSNIKSDDPKVSSLPTICYAPLLTQL
jgi:hypothetical protein